MVKGIALAVILIAIAATYWRPLRRVRTALAIDDLLATGHAFLVFGYLLGLIFGDRPIPLAEDISPIVAFVAGWVGFAAGMRFDLRVLRPVPARAFIVALLPAVAAAIAVCLAGGAVLLAAASAPEHPYAGAYAGVYAGALVLGAAAASSGPTLVAVVRGRRAGRSAQARPVLRMIEFSAGIDDLVVILLAVFAFAAFRPVPEPVGTVWLIAVGLGGGVLLGCVTWLFLGGRATQDERLLLGLAMLAFIAGFAGWLRLSPAGVAAIAAMVLVNLPGDRMAQLLEAVRRVERPAVIILMTVIGFHITGPLTWIFWPLVAIMTVGRMAAKHAAGAAVSGISQPLPGLRASRRWAYGLAPQGVLGLMVTLSFYHVWPDDTARTVLAAVAVASLVNEIVAPWLLLHVLKDVAPQSSGERSGKPAGEPSGKPSGEPPAPEDPA